MKINNMSASVSKGQFVVVRIVDGERWFYGVYSDLAKAVQVSIDIDGEVVVA